MIRFDHVAVAGETLAEALDYCETTLGVPLQKGGQHDVFGTHNYLLGLSDGLYFEAIAADPNAPTPTRPRWFDLDRFSGTPRLTNWICASDDIHAALAATDMDLGQPVNLTRSDLKWAMAVPQSGILPFDNCAPALIEWQAGAHPSTKLTDQGVTLKRLTVSHPKAYALETALKPLLQDPRIAFEEGAAALTASFQTPHGERTLE